MDAAGSHEANRNVISQANFRLSFGVLVAVTIACVHWFGSSRPDVGDGLVVGMLSGYIGYAAFARWLAARPERLANRDLALPALVLVTSWQQFPLAMLILLAGLQTIPKEEYEAAMVDGASPYRAFWDVVLPLARPALGATAIIAFLTAWNEYEFALVLTSTEKVRTISVAVASFIGEFTTEWNLVMAAAAVGTLPVAIIFLFFQRQLMQGLTGGAVKG